MFVGMNGDGTEIRVIITTANSDSSGIVDAIGNSLGLNREGQNDNESIHQWQLNKDELKQLFVRLLEVVPLENSERNKKRN